MSSVAPWIDAQLQRLRALPVHALLLQGPSGLGQYDLALGLARLWLCESPQPRGACGACASCHAIDVRTHADLCVLMPEAAMLALAWPLDEKTQAELDDKKRKASREIRVEAMRTAVEFTQRTSARGRGKVVLVYPADRMNAITANTLLKTLEEPAGDVRFVLASEAVHLLLPTIRSRCVAHTMAWPSEGAAREWLVGQGVPPADAPMLLRASGGRPVDAAIAAQEGRSAKAWTALPKGVARGDPSALAGYTPAQAVDALQKLCHDLMAIGSGAAPRFFAPADLPKPADPGALASWWRDLEREKRTCEHPYSAPLMLDALVSRARAALHWRAP